MSDQLNLQGTEPTGRASVFLHERNARLMLFRSYVEELPRILWVLLNPSIAGTWVDDPTVKQAKAFTLLAGFGSMHIVNLYGYIATDPRELAAVDDPVIRPENDDWIRKCAQGADRVVAAWGVNADPKRVDEVLELLPRPVYCLDTTKNGHPRHPLRVPHATTMRIWRAS